MTADELAELLAAFGLVEDPATPEVQALAREIAGLGRLGVVDEAALRSIVQAYARAIGRVAAATAELAVDRLAELEGEEREASLSRWVEAVAPLAAWGFDIAHRQQLERLTRRRLEAAAGQGDPHHGPATVAFVDLCGATRHMLGATHAELTDLADVIYATGQDAARRHGALAVKFLGDGVVLVARDPGRLLAAACEATVQLGCRTPLPARGGMAHGPVVRRAGDYLGPAVNLAHRLAELADAGTVLVDAEAVPGEGVRVERWLELQPRGLPEPRRCAVVAAG